MLALMFVLAGVRTVRAYIYNPSIGNGTGTVTSFSVVTANGVSASVANSTSTPAATFTLGAITPSSVASSGAVTSASPTASFGYVTGAGCAVAQATDRSTGVTCAGNTGAITTNNTSLAAGAQATFTVTDTSVAVGDIISVSARSGQTAATSVPFVTTVAAGSFKITLYNTSGATADTGAMIINFAVIKGVSS